MDVHEYLEKLVCERLRPTPIAFLAEYRQLCAKVQQDYPQAKPCFVEADHLSTTIPFYDAHQKLAIYPYVLAYPKEDLAISMKADRLLAKKAGIYIRRIKIAYLNRSYVRQGELDWDQLVCYGEQLANRKNHFHHSIMSLVRTAQVHLNQPLGRFELKKACLHCPQFDECFQFDLPDDSPFYLNTSPHKLEHLKQGIAHIKDLNEPLNRLQFAQFMASRLGGRFVDRIALKDWLNRIQEPLSFLDFEWQIHPIPPYDGLKPFDALIFLASLHQLDGNHLSHQLFFQTKDSRETLIHFLLDQIPPEGSILVYNKEGAEKLRVSQLAEQFPKYRTELLALCDRMVDLAKPFEAGLFYDNKMKGHYSLKAILPVFNPDLHYTHLKSGMDALTSYQAYLVHEDEHIEQELKEYCSLDSLALVEILKGLKEVCDA